MWKCKRKWGKDSDISFECNQYQWGRGLVACMTQKKWSEASSGIFCGNEGTNVASFMDRMYNGV